MYSIKAVAQATGLTVETLRAWERRYGIVVPGRDAGGRRVYRAEDVLRLRRLREATERGHPIGRLAGLSDDALASVLDESSDRRTRAASNAFVARILEAAQRFRTAECEQALTLAIAMLSPAAAGERGAATAAARSRRAMAPWRARDLAGTAGVHRRAPPRRLDARYLRPRRPARGHPVRHPAGRAARARPAHVGDGLRQPRLQGPLPRARPACGRDRTLCPRVGRGRRRAERRPGGPPAGVTGAAARTGLGPARGRGRLGRWRRGTHAGARAAATELRRAAGRRRARATARDAPA